MKVLLVRGLEVDTIYSGQITYDLILAHSGFVSSHHQCSSAKLKARRVYEVEKDACRAAAPGSVESG